MKEMSQSHETVVTLRSEYTPTDALRLASLLIDTLSVWKNNEATDRERVLIVEHIGNAVGVVMQARSLLIEAIRLANEIEIRKWPKGYPTKNV